MGHGTRSKTVFTEIARFRSNAPRHRKLSLSRRSLANCQCRLDGIAEVVLSPDRSRPDNWEIAARFDDLYGTTVSKDTITGTKSPGTSNRVSTAWTAGVACGELHAEAVRVREELP